MDTITVVQRLIWKTRTPDTALGMRELCATIRTLSTSQSENSKADKSGYRVDSFDSEQFCRRSLGHGMLEFVIIFGSLEGWLVPLVPLATQPL